MSSRLGVSAGVDEGGAGGTAGGTSRLPLSESRESQSCGHARVCERSYDEIRTHTRDVKAGAHALGTHMHEYKYIAQARYKRARSWFGVYR